MKNWDVLDWVLFMFSATICIVWIICFGIPALMGIPTTSENKELRSELINMLNNVTIAIIAILALKWKNDKL